MKLPDEYLHQCEIATLNHRIKGLQVKLSHYETALKRISNKEPNPMNSTAAWCIYHARETLRRVDL
jgi:hypothetical protein